MLVPALAPHPLTHRMWWIAMMVGLAVVGCGKGKERADDDDDDEALPAVAPPAAASSTQPLAAPQAATTAPGQSSTTWSFDSAPAGAPPPGFSFGRTGSGRLGRWIVRSVPDAPSGPNVL